MFIDGEFENEMAAWEAEQREALDFVNTDADLIEILADERAMGFPERDTYEVIGEKDDVSELDAMVDAMEQNFRETGRFELPATFIYTGPGR